MSLNLDIINQIYFFNIGRYQSNDSYFHWTSVSYHKSNVFDIRMTRNAPTEKNFYCIPKADIKLVYYSNENVVFCIGSTPEIQSQLLEALLEYLIERFFDMYDKSLLMTCYGDTCNIFDAFSAVIEDTLNNFKNLNLIKTALVSCPICSSTLPVVIKTTLIEKSEKTATPLVYDHSGHAILLYIDKHYKVRGHDIVTISY